MNIDDIQLMAYVDGELSPQECQRIENENATSSRAAERIALFRASRLPYRRAFAQQKLPPIPDGLMNEIEQMARAHATQPADTIGDGANANHHGQSPPPAQMCSRLQFAPAWLAVAFAGGALCCVALLQFAPGILSGLHFLRATLASIAPRASPWVQAAASYQRLYARETFEQIPVDESTSAKTVETIRREDGLALRVPDLHEAGLIFKRVQRLRFHDRPLIQIVYLPNKGAPVALCVIKGAKPDQDVTSLRVDDLNIVTWRRAGLGYALIGNNENIDLAALGKRISDRSVDQLFGGLDTTLPATPSG
jgi:anti-sigma factor RsiW